MARLPRHTLLLILGLPVVSAAPPGRVYAQLVRQGTTTPGQQAATGQNSMKSQTSLGKKRLSQEVQLTGDASWMDTGKLYLLRKRSEEHTSELQSRFDLVCRLLLEKKNKRQR